MLGMRVTRGEITGGPGKMQPAWRRSLAIIFVDPLCKLAIFRVLPFVRSPAENKAKTELQETRRVNKNIEFTRTYLISLNFNQLIQISLAT